MIQLFFERYYIECNREKKSKKIIFSLISLVNNELICILRENFT